ncbi:MAG: tyrosine-type recombinase/integrase [Marinifilaceae bacterium]
MEIDLFLSYLESVKRYSPHTISAYSEDLNQFFTYCREEELVDDVKSITSKMIRRWEMQLMDGGYSATSVKRKVSSLKTFFRYQEREGLITKNPTEVIKGPKSGKRLPVFIAEDKMEELLSERYFANDFVGIRDRLLLTLIYCTGLRRSEVTGLKWDDIDMSRRVLRVLGKGNKQREIPLLDVLIDLLSTFMSQLRLNGIDEKYVFVDEQGMLLTSYRVYRIVVNYLSRVTTQTKCSPHTLRHSFATCMLNNGAPIEAIKELLGHSSLAATQVYTHNSFENLKKVFNQAHPRA